MKIIRTQSNHRFLTHLALLKSTTGVILTLFFTLTIVSCASTKVRRAETDTVTDLSGKWNDTDSRLVSEEMIRDMSSRPWLDNFVADNNRNPVVIAGYIRNNSSEHIETTVFIKDIERSMLNSGRVELVANATERLQIRAERDNQQGQASEESVKALGEELGADFMLLGVISTQTDALDKTTAITYQVDIELISIESNRKTWIGNKKIKKIIKKRATTF